MVSRIPPEILKQLDFHPAVLQSFATMFGFRLQPPGLDFVATWMSSQVHQIEMHWFAFYCMVGVAAVWCVVE